MMFVRSPVTFPAADMFLSKINRSDPWNELEKKKTYLNTYKMKTRWALPTQGFKMCHPFDL